MTIEFDLSILHPDFRAWLLKAADENFDRFEAVHDDPAATVALIAELMAADVVYAAWEDPDGDNIGFMVMASIFVRRTKRKKVLCSVLPCADRETAMTIASEQRAIGERPPKGNA